MTTEPNETQPEKPAAKRPAFHAFAVNKKGYKTKVGVAFPEKDGPGFDVYCDAFPVDGRLYLRLPIAKSEA